MHERVARLAQGCVPDLVYFEPLVGTGDPVVGPDPRPAWGGSSPRGSVRMRNLHTRSGAPAVAKLRAWVEKNSPLPPPFLAQPGQPQKAKRVRERAAVGKSAECLGETRRGKQRVCIPSSRRLGPRRALDTHSVNFVDLLSTQLNSLAACLPVCPFVQTLV